MAVPLGQLRLHHHFSALWWLGLLYRRPQKVRESLEELSRPRALLAGAYLLLHALPWAFVFASLGWILQLGLIDPGQLAALGRLSAIDFAVAREIAIGITIGIAVGIVVEMIAAGIAPRIAVGIVVETIAVLFAVEMIPVGIVVQTTAVLFAFGTAVLFAVGIARGIVSGIAVGITFGITFGIADGIADGIAVEIAVLSAVLIAAGIAVLSAGGMTGVRTVRIVRNSAIAVLIAVLSAVLIAAGISIAILS